MANKLSIQDLREKFAASEPIIRAECAVHGVAVMPKSDKRGDVLLHRNEVKQLINTLANDARAILDATAGNPAEWKKKEAEYDKKFEAMDALGTVLAIDDHTLAMLDHSAAGYNPQGTMKAMRTASDFAAHYDRGHGGDGEVGIADFLRGVANMTTTPAVRNALSVGTDTAGGFSVPSRLMPGILAALVPVSSLMQAGAGIVPIEEGAKSFTTAAINAIPTAAWRAEAGALATSDPTFRAVTATPRSLAFQFKISRELLADGQNITEALYIAIAQSFAKELDRVGLLGSGTAPEPRGLLNTVGIQSVTNGANGAALGSYANIFSAVQAILQADAPMPTAAIMSPRSLVKLGGLADTTTQPLRVPSMLEKVKLIGTSQISNALTVGSSNDCSQIFVGDFSNLYFMMRENVSVQVLNELYAATGEIGFACHMRADVVLTYPAAFCAVTGVRP